MKSLLILACSKRKVPGQGNLPAIERYDGGSYRVVRKQQRERLFPSEVDIMILSAKFGLIHPSEQIPYYDLRLSREHAGGPHSEVQVKLTNLLGEGTYTEIYVDLGKDYYPAIQSFIASQNIRIITARGRIGERLRDLKEWLSSKR